jgi:hypothetical protein
MEELVNKHREARKGNYSTVFEIGSFESIRLPIFKQGDQFIWRRLLEYEQRKGFLQIQTETVTITDKGFLLAQKLRHDWD